LTDRKTDANGADCFRRQVGHHRASTGLHVPQFQRRRTAKTDPNGRRVGRQRHRLNGAVVRATALAQSDRGQSVYRVQWPVPRSVNQSTWS